MKKIPKSLLALVLCLALTTPAFAYNMTKATNATNKYYVIQGHDGNPDPDDNGAALAGYISIKRNMEKYGSNVNFLGFVYGDATEKGQNAMINGGGSSYHGSNGYANYKFYKQYTVPALKSVGCNVFYDTTPQTYHFNATKLEQMTTSGQFVANKILWAINNSNSSTNLRVVYSAGGGENVPAEAIKYLKNTGITDAQIGEHFVIIQHSKWNFESQTEQTAQQITKPYTIMITDQNGFSGCGKGVPKSVSVDRTSKEFANAWAVAVAGQKPNPSIPGFGAIDDVSDAGSHSFASNYPQIEKNWWKRNTGFTNRVSYGEYNKAKMYDDLCKAVAPTSTPKPTVKPTPKPTAKPTVKPTMKPTVKPTQAPSNSITLLPVSDAYLENGKRVNTNTLRVEQGKRTSYVKFDLSSVKGTITSAKLVLTCAEDSGSGDISIYSATSTNWTEQTLSSSNAPKVSKKLASLNQSYSLSKSYTWNLSASNVTAGTPLTVIIQQHSGNDVAFASKENHALAPKLILTVSSPSVTPAPTVKPTVKPTVAPTVKPTVKPTPKPTVKPTATPSQPVIKTVTLAPSKDAYMDNGKLVNTDILRVERNRRTSYLSFDLTKLHGKIKSAKLVMTCYSDDGYGTITVSEGSNTSWTEQKLSNSNAPVSSTELAKLNTTYKLNQHYTWNLKTSSLKTGSTLNFIVKQTSGNDVAFGSRTNKTWKPSLILEVEN